MRSAVRRDLISGSIIYTFERKFRKMKNVKKIIAVICTVLISAAAIFSVPAAAEELSGDMDGNGEITAADARSILRVSAMLDIVSEEKRKTADVNSDGEITAADARYVLRVAAKLDPNGQEIPYDVKAFINDCYTMESYETIPGEEPIWSIISVDGASLSMESSVAGITLRILTNNSIDFYMANPNTGLYTYMTDEFLELLGILPDELGGQYVPAGGENITVSDGSVINGKQSVVYTCKYDDGSRIEIITVDDEIVKIIDYYADNTPASQLDVISFKPVPDKGMLSLAGMREVDNDTFLYSLAA